MPSFVRAVTLSVFTALGALVPAAAQNNLTCREPVSNCAADADYFPNKVEFKHANASTITALEYSGTHVDVRVFSTALDEEFLFRLVRCGCEHVAGSEEGRTAISVPIGGAYVGDSVIMRMMTDEVDGNDFVKAVGSVTFVYSEQVKREVEAGRYTEVLTLANLEGVDGVDVLIINDFTVANFRNPDVSPGDLPVFVSTESGERDPMGRAEWVKLFGVLIGRENQASDVFESIESRYSTIRDLAFSARRRPSVLVNMPFPGLNGSLATWALPGGEQYTAALLRDANTDYLFTNDESKKGNTLSVDAVVGNFSSARYWINMGRFPAVNDDTIDKLVADDGGIEERFRNAFKELAAVKCGNVWSQSREITADGKANNYFEEGSLRPDLVLEDMLAIFHPDISRKGPEDTKFYYSLGEPSKAAGLDACPDYTQPLDAPGGKGVPSDEADDCGE